MEPSAAETFVPRGKGAAGIDGNHGKKFQTSYLPRKTGVTEQARDLRGADLLSKRV